MKKLLCALLAMVLCAALIGVSAETIVSGEYRCIVLDDDTVEITCYLGNAAELTIPETLDGHAVTGIGEKSFFCCNSLKTVIIPDSVTGIGDSAFLSCGSLKAVTIPDSVTSIGNKAFNNCVSLTSVKIPNSVTSIGNDAFSWCSSLTTVTIPDSVTTIGTNPFMGTSADIYVSPDHPTLAVIDGVLFDKTTKTLIFYPSGSYASSYTLPEGIKSIGDWAFSCSYSLTSVTIPESVTSIGNDAFYGCPSLTLTVERDSYAAGYAKENGIKYTYTDANDWLNS